MGMANKLLSKLLRRNKAGGILPANADEMARSKAHDLITLSPDIQGTNCSNCKYIDLRSGKCKHSGLKGISVNEHMCCIEWIRPGCIRPWEEDPVVK